MRKNRALFQIIFFITLLLLLLDYYVFQGITTLSSTFNQVFEYSINVLYWIISLGIISGLLYLLYSFIPGKKLTLIFNTIFNGFLGLFLSKFVFVVFLLCEDVYRIIAYVVHASPLMPGRSIVISEIAAGFALIPLAAFVFGITRGKYYYRIHKKTLYFKDLPDLFEGFTITQISDIHAGSFDNRNAVQRGVDLINAQGSDLFVFTGDLVNNVAEEIVPWIPIFKQIKARYGQFSILGNHDYGDYVSWSSRGAKQTNLENLKRYHQALGFDLLLDQNRKIFKGDQFITIAGVENWGLGFAQKGNLKKALEGVDAGSFKVLLSHDPSHWDIEVKNSSKKIDLTLSGHTHGMQFGIELGKYKWSPVKYRYPNWAGIASEKGKYLYVNRGFGFLGFSGRVGIWPEITVITLRKAG